MIPPNAVFENVSITLRRVAQCALLGLCLATSLLSQAEAVAVSPTFTVTRTADDLNPGSLRSALALASAVPGSTVNFQIPASDSGVSGGTALIKLALGELDIASSLNIVGPNATGEAIIVSGEPYVFGRPPANPSRVFSITAGTVAFSNLTVENGVAYGGGGGILNYTNLTLTGCTFQYNFADFNGAGIFNSGSSASLTMTNCVFAQNEVNGSDPSTEGGSGVANTGMLLMTGCLLMYNSAMSSNGGGLHNAGSASLSSCPFMGNQADGGFPGMDNGGGGVYNTGSLSLSNCLLTNNRTQRNGAGICNAVGAALSLSACTLSSNSTTFGTGGGINNNGSVYLTNCLVVNNTSSQAGGMNNSGGLTLINSTFSGNLASGNQSSVVYVGGLLSGPATLINDIFYFDASYATGVAVPSEIVAATGTIGPTVTYSDVQGGYTGTGDISADPQFVRNPISSFYTATDDTGDEHLQITSPAVHTGTHGPSVPLTDIEGTPRPASPATPSMGAYEVAGSGGSLSAQGGFTVTGTQNVSTGSQVVAKFLSGTTPATSFTATVDMGDGSVIPGIISPDPTAAGVYQVTVSYTYTGYGTFPLTVVLSGPGGVPTATVTSSATIQAGPGILSSLTVPSLVEGGLVLNGTVTLGGPVQSDTVVGLSSSDSSVVRIHRSVIVPAGSSSATFEIDTYRSHVGKTVSLTATLNSVVLTQPLTITGR